MNMHFTSQKIFITLFTLFFASLLFSTAGISIFLWALFIFFLFEISKELKTQSFKTLAQHFRCGLEAPLLLFGLWTLISSVLNSGTTEDFLICIWEMRFILGFYFLSYLLRKNLNTHLKTLFITLCAMVIINGVYGLLQTFFQIDLIRSTNSHLSAFGNFFRASGFFKIPLTYAYIISMLGFFSYSYALTHTDKKNKAFYWASVTFLFTIIGAAASWTRGAWIGLYAATMLITFLYSRKLALRVFFATTFFFIILLVNPDFRHRALSIVDISDYKSNTDRFDVWKANLKMTSDNPFFGVGWNQNHDLEKLKTYYQKVGITDAGIYDHAHNDFISIAAKLGYPGLVFFLWIILGFLYKTYCNLRHATTRNAKSLLLGALGAQIIFYLGSLTQANFTDMEVNHALFLVWAVVQSLSPRLSLQSQDAKSITKSTSKKLHP